MRSMRHTCFHIEKSRVDIKRDETNAMREDLIDDDAGVIPDVDVLNSDARDLQEQLGVL
jgi:hypothetical protein